MSDGWTLEIPAHGITLKCERLRRERHELIGELSVQCLLPGARTIGDHLLSVADFNFSSLRARQDRARHLADRAKTNGQIDWYGILEEFCQGVFEREREGAPAVDLWSLPSPVREDDFAIWGLAFPRRHPSILFGDGGSAKSYLALWMAGMLAKQGVKVGFFDWELCGEDHRERLQLLFSNHHPRPEITYCRCEGPLTHEIDRLDRVVRERQLAYAVFDSVSFAVDGRAEEHEVCARYFRAARQLGIGSLHIAHVNKSEEADRKPFGSGFWHNGARATWYVKAQDAGAGVLDIGIFHRKSNLGPLRHPVALRITFERGMTVIAKASMEDTPELAEKMSVRQRMVEVLKRGAMTAPAIADALGEKENTIRKTSQRSPQFVIINGGTGEIDKIGLREKSMGYGI